MGMYTELILGCRLREDTPDYIIEALDHVINHISEDDRTISQEAEEFIETYDIPRIFWSSSFYFGMCHSHRIFEYNETTRCYVLDVRSNSKSGLKIDKFLNVLVKYIKAGSGSHDIYAYVHYEEDKMPTIYSLTPIEE